MNSNQIFKGTLPFMWAKLLLGVITIGISIGILAILSGFAMLFYRQPVTGGTILIWLFLTGLVRFALMHYMGYLVKAGHVAVIAEAVTHGSIPQNQVDYGKQMVKERFIASNAYFMLDRLISGAVKQIQRSIQRVGNLLDAVPGIGALTGLASIFISVSLNYIDECCLAYTFCKQEENPFKAGADGVVIYAQNWKILLQSAAKTAALLIVLMVATVFVVFLVLGGLFRILNWSGMIAFILACLVTWVIKFAFIDSYVLIRIMTTYLSVAPETQVTVDLYDKFCGLSAKFKELFEKGQEEQTV